MRLAFQLAYKNLIGAGLRTWLNSIVLSFAFVLIIFFNGLLDGWNQQARLDGINWEYASGHLVNDDYDVYDPFSIQDGHAVLSKDNQANLTPILVRQATIYPQGRMLPIMLKGIDPHQSTVKLPTSLLRKIGEKRSVIIGKRMAETTNLKLGDEVLLRWRDKNGTYDASSITIVGVFDTNVASVDSGQMWISIYDLWEMTALDKHASLFIANENYIYKNIEGWRYEDREYLLKELTKIIKTKKMSSSIMYFLLLSIGLLAIFDTQVLSVFRRQKEIGTYISLGMTRFQVVKIFTAEGSMYSIFSVFLAALYGVPLLGYLAKFGITFPMSGDDYGIIMAETIYPVYSLKLVFGTIIIIVLLATIVSFLPARKISKMNPVEALKGKLQ